MQKQILKGHCIRLPCAMGCPKQPLVDEFILREKIYSII